MATRMNQATRRHMPQDCTRGICLCLDVKSRMKLRLRDWGWGVRERERERERSEEQGSSNRHYYMGGRGESITCQNEPAARPLVRLLRLTLT
jgi:hypothetical protein